MIRDVYSEKIKSALGEDCWLIEQTTYEESENLKYESLFALSNGSMGVRGFHEEGTRISLPYVYINGVFDKSETFMRELATLPNWLGIRLYIEKEPVAVGSSEIVEFHRTLNMKNASLVKRVHLKDSKGRETLIEAVRFVSRNNIHRMGVKLYVTPLNYSGILEIENIIDGSVVNFYDAPRFKVKHTYPVKNELLTNDGVYLEVATRENHLHVGCGSRMRVYVGGKDVMKNRQAHAFGEQAVEFGDVNVEQGTCYEIVKYASVYTERDCNRNRLYTNVEDETTGFIGDGFEREFEKHAQVYERMWDNADICIGGDPEIDRAIRFNIFHLMSTGNENDPRVNVGAKLLTGEEYGGHAFWDTELFMLPFFSYVFPETAANLENYRYHLLGAAKENARKNGYKGAQYPWESADDGTEQCPDWTIEPDGSCYRCYVAQYEHHVTAAVAYGVYHYVKITKDYEYLWNKGAEILMETARFWASRCEYAEEESRYEIRQVTGPDEWHEPVDNNLYTNYLAKWNLEYVTELLNEMRTHKKDQYAVLCEKTGFVEKETKKWNDIIQKMYLPRKEGTKLLEQFEGYFELDNVQIEQYDKNDWPIKPEILKTKGAAATQIIKQADVVMLLHLLGHEFDRETLEENYHYYEKRTLHGSSLSPSIYSVMGLKIGDDSKAYRYLKRAALLDLLNLQRNTREGIHAANTGGIWQVVVFGFAGVSIGKNDRLCINPKLPKEWDSIVFRLHYDGSWIEIRIGKDNQPVVKLLAGKHLQIECGNRVLDI